MTMNILSTGTVLENRYRILSLLGQGGMSRVYLAEDARLGVRVAIKENLPTSREAQTQFEREAQILARLSHPNLPRVTDHFVDTQTGRQYLVMDYIEGEDLDAIIKRAGPLPETTALAWIRQIMDALEYLHRQQPPVIHRDVKPGNIKITPEGKAILVDFGIAKVYDPRQATLTGARAVTPGYAPPEQYGLRTTERSDIYGLGATLYTMLTGRVPPEAPLRTSGEEVLVPPSQIVPGKISQVTEQAILRAMDVETDKRWHNVAQLRTALEGRGVPPPLPVSSAQPAAPPTGKTQVRLPAPITWPATALVLGGIAIMLLLMCFLAGLPRLRPGILPTPISTPTATLAPTKTPISTNTSPPNKMPTPTNMPTPPKAPTSTNIPTPTKPPTSLPTTVSPEQAVTPTTAKTSPLYHKGQVLRVRVKSNLWTRPDVTVGVRYSTIPADSTVRLEDDPVWGPARTDRSIFGWWCPIQYNGRLVWIIEDNLTAVAQ